MVNKKVIHHLEVVNNFSSSPSRFEKNTPFTTKVIHHLLLRVAYVSMICFAQAHKVRSVLEVWVWLKWFGSSQIGHPCGVPFALQCLFVFMKVRDLPALSWTCRAQCLGLGMAP